MLSAVLMVRVPVPSLVSVGLVEPTRSLVVPSSSAFFVNVTWVALSTVSMTEPASMLAPVIVIPGVKPAVSSKVRTLEPATVVTPV